MNTRRLGQFLLIGALTAGVAVCGKSDLEEEQDDVVEAQQEAAEQAERTPGDTAAIREKGNEVVEEQREAKEALQEELEEKNIPSSTTQQ